VTVDFLKPIQERYHEIRHSEELLHILRDGAERASVVAEETLRKMKDAMGVL
jgi:tryptophanyl-tRNA synthetase